jgi:hypothetical protein
MPPLFVSAILASWQNVWVGVDGCVPRLFPSSQEQHMQRNGSKLISFTSAGSGAGGRLSYKWSKLLPRILVVSPYK